MNEAGKPYKAFLVHFEEQVHAEIMDAHQWHGNTNIVKQSEDAERISLVLYYRTDMMFCGTMEAEAEKENYLRLKPLKRGLSEDDVGAMEAEFVVKGRISS